MEIFEKYYCHGAQKIGEPHISYHDTEYGFPAKNDNELFRRLMLEINQAGLSWTTILKKREGFINAFENFDINKVANYGEKDKSRLLADAGIIRNKLKVNAAIHNAQRIKELQAEHGSFKKWLELQSPKPLKDWVKLFKKNFKFTGGEITKEFLIGTGFIKGAHHPNCPQYARILELSPNWLKYETD